ncbi:MAG: penicillin-binding protein 2 [Acidobacteriaceae bacterium]
MASDNENGNNGVQREEKVASSKLAFFQYFVLALMLALSFRLWRLQIVGSEKYAQLALENRIREVPVLAPRGKILEREGRVIVDNYPSFSALLLREDNGERLSAADYQKYADALHISIEQIKQRIRGSATQGTPVVVKDEVSFDELSYIESHRDQLPMLEVMSVSRRLYPKNGFAAHLIGYVGQVSEAMLDQPQYELYQPGAVVGQSGLEQWYNDVLMGEDGSRRVLVNSTGKEVGKLNNVPAVPGHPLKTTIDLDIQKAAEEALEGRNGAIIAMDPRTGNILAMVSRPAFDPNAFAVRISRQDWNKLVTDEAHPLLNKAIQAQLAPGSVFKIIMSVAGTEEGIAQNLHVNCSGGGVFYGRYFKCWVTAEHRTHGAVDLSKGIFQSCDVFFYTLAERLGISKIAKWAHLFGLGHKTGIDLANEASGVMPSEEWKLRNFRQKWFAGETISVGIGQGAVATTPIQLLRAVAGVSSDGVLRRPRLVDPAELPEEMRQRYIDKADATGVPEEVKIPIDQQSWMTITDAMAGVVTPGVGTAPSAHLQGIDFAGKTGSAQILSNALKAKLGGGKKLRDNGWFVGVAPRRDPEIAVVTLLEQGEHGYLAARAASQVIRAYVDKRRLAEHNAVKTARGVAAEKPIEAAGIWGADAKGQGAGGSLNGGSWKILPGVRDGAAALMLTPAYADSLRHEQEAH